MVSVRAALAQAPPVLDDGRPHASATARSARCARVTLPLIAPGLGAGAALVFLAVVTELTATLLLAPTRHPRRWPREFWNPSSSLAYGAAAPYAALLVAALRARDLPAHPRRSDEARPHDGTHRSPDVTKAFGSTPVLHGVDLHVPARTLTAVLGPSGCGKTTLLRLVAGFDDAGLGHDRARRPTSSPEPAAPWPPERRRVGYVAQEGALFPHLTVAANIALRAAPAGAPAAAGSASCWSWSG